MGTRRLAGRLPALLVSVAMLAGCTAGPTSSRPATTAQTGAPSSAGVPSQDAWPLPSGASADEYFQAGNALAAQRRWGEAVEAYTKAIELDPTLADAHLNRARSYTSSGELDLGVDDYTKAIEFDTKAIELDPTDAHAFYSRGLAYNELGKLDLAIADFTKTIELDPTAADAYAVRGAARALGGDTTGATADFDKALSLATDPDLIKDIKQLRCSVRLGCE